MLLKALGVVDLIIGAILIFGTGLELSIKFLMFIAIFMLIKSSFGFWKDFGSWIDVFVGIIFLLMIIISIPKFVGIVFGIFLIQKGFFSML